MYNKFFCGFGLIVAVLAFAPIHASGSGRHAPLEPEPVEQSFAGTVGCFVNVSETAEVCADPEVMDATESAMIGWRRDCSTDTWCAVATVLQCPTSDALGCVIGSPGGPWLARCIHGAEQTNDGWSCTSE